MYYFEKKKTKFFWGVRYPPGCKLRVKNYIVTQDTPFVFEFNDSFKDLFY